MLKQMLIKHAHSILITIVAFLVIFLPIQNICGQKVSSKKNTIEFWHHKLADHLSIDRFHLKLAQGTIVVGATSYWLWTTLDAMTPNDSSIYHTPGAINNFSSEYSKYLTQLPTSGRTNTQCNLNEAILKYKAANGIYAWNKTINDLNSELTNSDSFELKSDTLLVMFYDDSISTKTKLSLSVKYEHLSIVHVRPFEHDNKTLLNNAPWYSNCIMSNGYRDSISSLWRTAFGPNGSFKNINTALIVAQNGSVKISMENEFETFTVENTTSISPIVIAFICVPMKTFIADETIK